MVLPIPGMDNLPETNEQKATKYINSIYKTEAYKKHKQFFEGYLNQGYPVILAHIRNGYKKYVLSNEWSQDKFDTVLYVLISNEQKLTNIAFENMGKHYDNGSIQREKAYADFKNNPNLLTPDNDNDDDVSDDDLYNFLNGLQ